MNTDTCGTCGAPTALCSCHAFIRGQKLREAAQAVIDARDNHGYSPALQAAMNALHDALQLGEQLGEQELKTNAIAKFLEWHAEVVKLAVLAEREACAEICAKFYWDAHVEGAQHCESAIRARGQE
jgi:hypothetical protein